MAPEPEGSWGTEDALRRLESRLIDASDAAERLLAEAAQNVAARTSDPRPPPAGWRAPPLGGEGARTGAGGPRTRGTFGLDGEDLELLARLLGRARELVPAELERRLVEALRELLLALRALIDAYLERIERRRAAPAQVTDIPIS